MSKKDACLDVLNRLLIAEQYFKGTKYGGIVETASAAFAAKRFEECLKELDKLPSREDLFESLLEKLKGKSVYRTLEKIKKGQTQDSCSVLKAISSLLTHAAIEVEQGNREYRYLFPTLLDRLCEIVYSIR